MLQAVRGWSLTVDLMCWAATRRFGWWEIGHLGLHFVARK